MGYEMLPLAPYAIEQAGQVIEGVKQNAESVPCSKDDGFDLGSYMLGVLLALGGTTFAHLVFPGKKSSR